MAVDQHTAYTVIAPCPSHESQAVAKNIFKHGIRWAGPPDVLVCDGERGLGASLVFPEKLSIRDDDFATPSAHALNQRVRRLGIPPATRVFGQRTVVYGELMEHGEVVPFCWTKETSLSDASPFGRQRERPWKNMPPLKRSEEQRPHVPGQ